MVSDFCRLTKQLRYKNNELLGDMASKIGVSSAFLSRVENNYAKPSEKMIQNIISAYHLTGTHEEQEIEQAAYALRNSNLFDLSRMSVRDKKIMIAMAQQLPKLTSDQIKAINDILERSNM